MISSEIPFRDMTAKEWEVAFDAIPDLISIQNPIGIILQVNKAYAVTFHLPHAQMIGRKFSEFFSGIEKLHTQVLETKSQAVGEFFEPGLKDYFEANVSPLFNEHGEVSGVIHVLKNIRERKHAQERLKITNNQMKTSLQIGEILQKDLEAARKKAEQSARVKSEFLANMSHEIRTPMNSIIGFSNLMQDTDLDDVQKQYLEKVKTSGQLLLSLINDILDISKIEAGKIELESVDFDLEHLIEDMIKILHLKVQEKGLDLSYGFEKDFPRWFKGDPTKIRQIILNIVNNAVKFTEKGGITLRVKRDHAKIKDGQPQVIISIEDTGIGISPEGLEKLFKPFSQVDGSITRRFGGTGLGLAISKSFVSQMGGDIQIRSQEGKGTEFMISLPLQQGKSHPPDDLLLANEEFLKDKRVALVDDNANAREIAAAYLEHAGMKVVFAASGAREFIKRLSAEEVGVDVIVSDIMMPDMSGLGLVKELRADGRYAKVKIMALTSDSRAGTAKEAYDAGFDAYLAKPILKRELIDVIRTMMGDKREKKELVTRHTAKEISLKDIRVLVAEDMNTNWELLSIYLGKFGCIREHAVNGKEAVEKLRANDYDVVLMDMQMPVMDGIQATQVIRKELGKDIPIIALTAAAMKEDQEKALAAGMNDFITKPIDVERLKAVILKWGKSKI